MRRQRPSPALIQGHPLYRFTARRFKPGLHPHPFEAQRLASESYRSSSPVNPDEVAALLGRRRLDPRRGHFFRYDGHGIWVGTWDGRRELVRTYLTPRRSRTWPYPCHIRLVRRRAVA